MKVIKYNLCTKVNCGTAEEPVWEDVLSAVTLGWSEENEQLAKDEAHNGEYTIEDDGTSSPDSRTVEDRISEMEEALDMLLSGVTE